MQEVIQTANAPGPFGPYSQAVVWENIVFIAGQGPIDPATGTIPDSFPDQARQILANLDALLASSGSSRKCVLKVQLYLSDLTDFDAFNEVYAEFFEGCAYPARTTVGASALPGGVRVEIDAVAYREAPATA